MVISGLWRLKPLDHGKGRQKVKSVLIQVGPFRETIIPRSSLR